MTKGSVQEAKMIDGNGKRSLRMGLLIFGLWLGVCSSSFAQTPAVQIKATIDQVLAVLRDPALRSDERAAERRELLRQAVLPRFDFDEMAKRSLGSHWKDQGERQEEFVAAFSGLVENAYIARVESFKDEKIVIGRERVEQNLAEVQTQIVPSKGEPFSVNYRLHLVGSEWKAYDVVVDNISLVSNYRSQFHRFLTNASFDELLQKLREKSSRIGN